MPINLIEDKPLPPGGSAVSLNPQLQGDRVFFTQDRMLFIKAMTAVFLATTCLWGAVFFVHDSIIGMVVPWILMAGAIVKAIDYGADLHELFKEEHDARIIAFAMIDASKKKAMRDELLRGGSAGGYRVDTPPADDNVINYDPRWRKY